MLDVNELCVIVRLSDVGVINLQVSGAQHQIYDVSQPRQWNNVWNFRPLFITNSLNCPFLHLTLMFFPPPQFRASFVFNPLQLSSSFSLPRPRSYHSDTTQKYSCSPLLVLIQGLHGRFNLHRVPLLFKTSVELLFPTNKNLPR